MLPFFRLTFLETLPLHSSDYFPRHTEHERSSEWIVGHWYLESKRWMGTNQGLLFGQYTPEPGPERF